MASRATPRGRRGNHSKRSNPPRDKTELLETPTVGIIAPQNGEEEGEPAGDDVCFICAENVKFYALSECNHRTCHVCALRLRALYKKRDCTFCKHPQSTIVFTLSEDKQYQDYEPESIQFTDEKLSVAFETQEMMEESLILLRFNCPDSDCDYVANGWPDLKWHVREGHQKVMCDLCIRNKKIFSHEHTLYSPNDLPLHVPSLTRRGPHVKDKDKEIESHPMCDFCKICFFGDDELYGHLRERHEECFVCKKQGIQHQYFLNYVKLEHHFRTGHYPCTHPTCLEQKFVVFPTQLDLQAHTVDVHSDEMNNRDKRGARRIDVTFEQARGPGTGRNRGGGEGQPEPPPPPRATPVSSSIGSSSVSGTSGQPIRNIPGGTRRAAFGGQLTTSAPGDGPPTRQIEDDPPSTLSEAQNTATGLSTTDPAIMEQHAAFMAHIQSLTSSPNALTAIRLSIRSYRSNESTVYDALDTIFNVLERDMDKTGGVITRLIDLFEDEEKKKDLLEAWGGMKVEHRRQFPTLTPLSSENSSNYAGITSGRVINVKHSTAKHGSNNRSTRGIWDRVEQAASSSSRTPPPGSTSAIKSRPGGRVVPGSVGPQATDPTVFPVLSGSGSGTNTPTGASRSAGIHSTPWTQSSSGKVTPTPPVQPYSVNMTTTSSKGRSTQPAPPPISNAQFPGLPSSGNKTSNDYKAFVGGNQSLKKIRGGAATPPQSAWAGGSANEDTSGGEGRKPDVGESSNPGGSGRSKKKKGKETLFTLGSIG